LKAWWVKCRWNPTVDAEDRQDIESRQENDVDRPGAKTDERHDRAHKGRAVIAQAWIFWAP